MWTNFWLVKTDPNGNMSWSRSFGGIFQDICYSVDQTSDGGYILAGYTQSFGAGNWDFWLVKTNANGDSMWSRTFGGIRDDRCYSVQQTSDDGYILAGRTFSFGQGVPYCQNFYLVKTDANGDTLWTRAYGGDWDESCYSVQQTSGGGYILGGWADTIGTNTNMMLVRTNGDGNSTWTRTYGGPNWDECTSVQQTSEGGYILAGYTDSFGAGDYDFWLVRVNVDGDTAWSRTFGGEYDEYCYSVRQTSDGGYILAGSTVSYGVFWEDFWLVKTDEDGDSLWSRTFGGSQVDWCTSVQQTSDGAYILAGGTSSFGAGWQDFWLVKTGPERPYYPCVSLDETGTNPVLRWISPHECDHIIYFSTDMGGDLEPPGPSWSIAVTLLSVPAGPASWTDPSGIVTYKRYAITMSCP